MASWNVIIHNDLISVKEGETVTKMASGVSCTCQGYNFGVNVKLDLGNGCSASSFVMPGGMTNLENRKVVVMKV